MSDLKSFVTQELPAQTSRLIELGKARFRAAEKPTQMLVIAGCVVLVLAVILVGSGGSDINEMGITFQARRGVLNITVVEGGNIEALKSQQIRSAIKGREGTKILSIVEEGYRVTEQDVLDGKILVELDYSQLEERKLNQEISVETAESTYIERKAQLEIQINQNISDLNSSRQNVKFSRLDFEKHMGANIVAELVDLLDIEERIARFEERSANAARLGNKGILDRVRQARQEDRSTTSVSSTARGRGDQNTELDPAILDSMSAQMRERMQQMMDENGGTLPAEMVDRLTRRSASGFSGGRGQGGNGSGGRRGQGRPDGSGDFSPGGGDFGRGGNPRRSRDNQPVDEDALTPRVELAGVDRVEIGSLTDISIATTLMDEEYMEIRDVIDFSAFADLDKLEDGEAKQQLRALEDALRVAREEHILAQDQLEGQRRLADRGYITPRELEAEELKVIRREVGLQSARTDLTLYTQYTFPKEAEQQLASYEEAIMEFQRKRKEGEAKIAQDQARFKSAERKFNMEVEKLADLEEQIEFTVIRAEVPGLVVYGSAEQNSRPFRGGFNQEPIQEGATVRERQPILTIPDMTEMAVRVNIHESAVKRVSVGQKVIVTVDAFANVELTGEVIKVAVVADSANAFMNPDLKVYPTMVRVDGIHDWLRPGMSAEVEILVETLADVVYVPIQAVTYFEDKQVVYITRGGRPQMREVKIGSFSEQFIEVISGLEEGEAVMLLPPRGSFL